MFRRGLLLLPLALLSWPVMAQSIDFNLSNDSMEFRYIVESGTNLGGTELDAGMLYNSDDDLVGMLGMQVVGETGSGTPGLDAGVGFKLFGFSAGQMDVLSLAVGGQLDFTPASQPRLGAFVRGYYAPDIVSFIDSKGLLYASAGLEYDLLTQASAYLGYRKLEAERSAGNYVVDNGMHVGIRLQF